MILVCSQSVKFMYKSFFWFICYYIILEFLDACPLFWNKKLILKVPSLIENQRICLKKVGSFNRPEMEFKEFEPRFKSGLNLAPAYILKHLIQFKVEPTIFKPRLKFKPPLRFNKFGHRFIIIVLDGFSLLQLAHSGF